jgi:hypothetical protein
VLTVALANAQSAASSLSTSGAPAFSAAAESSSLETADLALPADPAAEPAAPSAAAGGAGQQYGRQHHSLMSRLTYEAGGGFNAPVGNDTPFITWGGNFTFGAGLRFSKWVSALLEYQFMDDKLPGSFIAWANEDNTSGTAITAGDAHIHSITASPVIDLTPKRSNGAYLAGGWGYYHKSTNFNGYECCAVSYYGYYDVEVTLASITSNQWGGNAGLGIYHRLGGGLYGGDSHTQLFAEARYTFIHTPPVSQTNGFGTTRLIPVTLGVRF